MNYDKSRIAIIGLGYVGMPLAFKFNETRQVLGFDVNTKRVDELRAGYDRTREVSDQDLRNARNLEFSSNPSDLKSCDIFIVAVPTPVDTARRPDMSLLESASKTVGSAIKRDSIVVFESTVYPGATEEICVPILSETSGLEYNKDFFCGYSPERINPGDKNHTISKIVKVTSGSTPEIAEIVDDLYASVIDAGTHKASSIRIAEAAKVIENTQRDVNIALVNELAIIFNKLGIETNEVLDAACTKWNFINFRPGLVGGHCIGVDPYYLTHKAQEIGHHPEIILAGRRLNDLMPTYVSDEVIKLMLRKGFQVLNSKVLILGFTFKENCPDFRNTKVADLADALGEYGAAVDIYDPWIDLNDARREFDLNFVEELSPKPNYECIILAVPHAEFLEREVRGLTDLGVDGVVVYDIKSALNKTLSDGSL